MKSLFSIAAVVLAAVSLSSIHTDAANSVTNETDMSSMYGVNDEFEYTYTKSTANPFFLRSSLKLKTFKGTLSTNYSAKVAKVTHIE